MAKAFYPVRIKGSCKQESVGSRLACTRTFRSHLSRFLASGAHVPPRTFPVTCRQNKNSARARVHAYVCVHACVRVLSVSSLSPSPSSLAQQSTNQLLDVDSLLGMRLPDSAASVLCIPKFTPFQLHHGCLSAPMHKTKGKHTFGFHLVLFFAAHRHTHTHRHTQAHTHTHTHRHTHLSS